MKILSPPQVSILLFFCLLVLLIGGWFNRNQLVAQFYFVRFQIAQTEESKCQNLLQILRVSPEANLNSVIQKIYPEGQYDLERSTILSNKYVVAEIAEFEKSMVYVVLFKKELNGNLQIIYSVGKFLG